MTGAFYAVIVLTLAVAWDMPAESLLGSLCSGNRAARHHVSAGGLAVGPHRRAAHHGDHVLRARHLLDPVRPGAQGRHADAVAGALRVGRVRRHLPFGRHRLDHPHRPRAGHAMGVNGLWGQRRSGALRHRARRADHARPWRAAFIVPGIVCLVVGTGWRGRSGAAASAIGRCRRRPAFPGRNEFWRVFPSFRSPWRSRASSGQR